MLLSQSQKKAGIGVVFGVIIGLILILLLKGKKAPVALDIENNKLEIADSNITNVEVNEKESSLKAAYVGDVANVPNSAIVSIYDDENPKDNIMVIADKKKLTQGMNEFVSVGTKRNKRMLETMREPVRWSKSTPKSSPTPDVETPPAKQVLGRIPHWNKEKKLQYIRKYGQGVHY